MKNKVIKATACIAVLLFVLAMSAMDSESVAVPVITMIITGGYLAFLGYANHWFLK